MLLRNILSRGFFTSKSVSPPRLVAVGAQAILGYTPAKRCEFLKANAGSALKDVPHDAVTNAVAFIDDEVSGGAHDNSHDYVIALNASLATFAEDALGSSLSTKQVDDIIALEKDIHFDAIANGMSVSTDLLEILEAVKRGTEECKLALVANGGPLLKDVIEQNYEAVLSVVEGNVITSCDIGKPLLNHADGFKSVASKMFTSTKDTFFINNEADSVRAAQLAGCVSHHYRGSKLLKEELVRVGLTFKKNPITGAITEKASK